MKLILTVSFGCQDNLTSAKDGKNDEKNPTASKNARNFHAAPKKTLNLANVSATSIKKDWVSRAEKMLEKTKESRRVRKKRLWLEQKEGNFSRPKTRKYVGSWEYAPDLVLELIFQHLPFEVNLYLQQTLWTVWGVCAKRSKDQKFEFFFKNESKNVAESRFICHQIVQRVEF